MWVMPAAMQSSAARPVTESSGLPRGLGRPPPRASGCRFAQADAQGLGEGLLAAKRRAKAESRPGVRRWQ